MAQRKRRTLKKVPKKNQKKVRGGAGAVEITYSSTGGDIGGGSSFPSPYKITISVPSQPTEVRKTLYPAQRARRARG